jgi:transposase
MLGPAKPRRLHEPIAVSLDDLIPRDHFSRHLEANLDLSFVREWTRERYAERGSPSIDPVVFFTLQLVMVFEGMRSERKLIETASLNLADRWYLGYALDESLPDHSSLTRIRQRLGVTTIERFFEKIVDVCQEAGLIGGRELYVAATKVLANADLDSLVPRFYHEAMTHVADLFAADPPTGDEVTSPAGMLQLRPSVQSAAATPSPPARNAPRRESRRSVKVLGRCVVMGSLPRLRDVRPPIPAIRCTCALLLSATCTGDMRRCGHGAG